MNRVLPAYAGMIRIIPMSEEKGIAVLPAYAGMILDEMGYPRARPRAPRVCGDDPLNRLKKQGVDLCSPRMRG